MKVKTRALRQRVWFKTLSRVDRAIIDLTIRCVEKVRSSVLTRSILTILDKMLKTLEENFMTRAERVGYKIAENLCTLGERWGNKACSSWKRDKSFVKLYIRYLRQKIEEKPHSPKFILTERGVGYHFAVNNGESDKVESEKVGG